MDDLLFNFLVTMTVTSGLVTILIILIWLRCKLYGKPDWPDWED